MACGFFFVCEIFEIHQIDFDDNDEVHHYFQTFVINFMREHANLWVVRVCTLGLITLNNSMIKEN